MHATVGRSFLTFRTHPSKPPPPRCIHTHAPNNHTHTCTELSHPPLCAQTHHHASARLFCGPLRGPRGGALWRDGRRLGLDSAAPLPACAPGLAVDTWYAVDLWHSVDSWHVDGPQRPHQPDGPQQPRPNAAALVLQQRPGQGGSGPAAVPSRNLPAQTHPASRPRPTRPTSAVTSRHLAPPCPMPVGAQANHQQRDGCEVGRGLRRVAARRAAARRVPVPEQLGRQRPVVQRLRRPHQRRGHRWRAHGTRRVVRQGRGDAVPQRVEGPGPGLASRCAPCPVGPPGSP